MPPLGLNLDDRVHGETGLNHQLLDDDGPAITRPVTSQKRVRIAHDGRRIVLGFDCGFTEATVLNRILDRRIVPLEGQRLPKGFRYAGQGRLDLELYFAQPDPIAALDGLLRMIRAAGGEPALAPGFLAHLGNRVRRSAQQATPLRHDAWITGAASAEKLEGTARKAFFVDRTRWRSPVVNAGITVEFHRDAGGRYTYERGGNQYTVSLDEINSLVVVANDAEGWETVHEGLLRRYPGQAARLRARITVRRSASIVGWTGNSSKMTW